MLTPPRPWRRIRLGLALCADACGGRTVYYWHGECECADAQHAAYGRTP